MVSVVSQSGGSAGDGPARFYRVVLRGLQTPTIVPRLTLAGRQRIEQAQVILDDLGADWPVAPIAAFNDPTLSASFEYGFLHLALADYVLLTAYAFDVAERVRKDIGSAAIENALAAQVGLSKFRPFVARNFDLFPTDVVVEFGEIGFGSLTWYQKVGAVVSIGAGLTTMLSQGPSAIENYNRHVAPAIEKAKVATDAYILEFGERVGEQLNVQITPANPPPSPPARNRKGGGKRRDEDD